MIKRKALSPVISSLILSAAVLTIGGGIWSYSMGASSFIASDYTQTTTDMVHMITERFNIEYVEYDGGSQNVAICVYNYGGIRIKINTIITINEVEYYSYDQSIDSKTMEQIVIPIGIALAENEEVSIRIVTERENTDYELYYTP